VSKEKKIPATPIPKTTNNILPPHSSKDNQSRRHQAPKKKGKGKGKGEKRIGKGEKRPKKNEDKKRKKRAYLHMPLSMKLSWLNFLTTINQVSNPMLTRNS
jgi:hypothetical protein